jgi:hypothetical protein
MAATMPQNTKTNNEVTCLLSSETPVLSALPEQSKPIPVKAISAACGISVDVGALAGSVASLLLLGAFSPFATLLSISIVSVKLQRTSLGELCAFLYGGGLAGCQGLLITVLSLMSLSAALGTVAKLAIQKPSNPHFESCSQSLSYTYEETTSCWQG